MTSIENSPKHKGIYTEIWPATRSPSETGPTPSRSEGEVAANHQDRVAAMAPGGDLQPEGHPETPRPLSRAAKKPSFQR